MKNAVLITETEKVVNSYRNADDKGKQMLIELYGCECFGYNDYRDLNGLDDALKFLKRSYSEAFPEEWMRHATSDEVGYRRIKIMIEANNKIMNWEPDYSNKNQNKWFPYFNVKGGPGVSGFGLSLHGVGYDYADAFVGSRLIVGAKEEALHIEKIAHDDYVQFFS